VILAVTACGSGGRPNGRPRASDAVQGGTAYFAEQPLTPPTDIFPLVSGANFTITNTSDFQTLMYRPLFWYGDGGRPVLDPGLSIGDAPVYSDDDRVVTISLKRTHWSDGELVSARDVGFWIDLVKANRLDWASYVPGGFPDNVTSWAALGPETVRLQLNASYNPIWFTDNELSQITPLPIAWDRTSLTAPPPSPHAAGLPDTTPAGARDVYAFLNEQSKQLATYASSSIWSIVDGPWKLTGLTSTGLATFRPNPRYDGPNRPRLARFVELPFTADQTEFGVLKSGPARGGPGHGSASQISVGYVPPEDIPDRRSLVAQGYRLIADYPYGFDYFEPNFNNPSAGPIFRQLYFRQAFQHLVDQRGWIHAYYFGLGVPTYSPVPALPANPYADRLAAVDPYPFSVGAARAILIAHGWRVVSGRTTTCARPGTAADECGAGIPRGKPLTFTLMYPGGLSYTDQSMADLEATAARVGIAISLHEETSAAIAAQILSCAVRQPACGWQLGQYGTSWLFTPDHYPTGEEIFQTGALGNVGSYSSRMVDRLILATTRARRGAAQRALDAYADAVRAQLPDFWQPAPGTLISVQANLRGVVPNAYGFINPEEWYFTK
jgi:peptide/nickel transport system substrate-binding protein